MKLSMSFKKQAICLMHLLFLILACIGVGTIYINDNYGKGLTGIHNVVYEDTDAFTSQVNSDLSDLFYYYQFRDFYEVTGNIDLNRTILRMTFGPGDEDSFSALDLTAYLKTRGYNVSDTFLCTRSGVPEPLSENSEGYLIWSALNPEIETTLFSGGTRVKKETIALQLMDSLHRYSTAYSRLVAGQSNLHYRIEYRNPAKINTPVVYTNDSALDADNVRFFGRYVRYTGDTVFYDTNLKTLSLNTLSDLTAANPFEGDSCTLLAAVDTSYPVKDLYADSHTYFIEMQNLYIAGSILLLVGSFVAAVTLIYLMKVSGHKENGDRTITLHRFDNNPTEAGILLFALFGAAAAAVAWFAGSRVLRLLLPKASWTISQVILCGGVIYLASLLLFFSLLRRYKAGVLWKNSLVYRFGQQTRYILEHKSFRGRLVISYLVYFLVNAALIILAWHIWDRTVLSRTLALVLIGLVAFALVVFDVLVFSVLCRHATQMDYFQEAVDRLASGETSYKVDLNLFDGQELELATGLNRISSGLETALSESVKSERLKADLITNVSHDIKTPLTSIINYVGLLKREHIEDPKVQSYIEVLDQKSQRLKTLTEDLVEASKASSGNINLDMARIDLVEMVEQTNGEFEEKLLTRRLTLITNASERPLFIMADGRRLWRVLENLYNNTCKYAMDGSRVYVDIMREGADVVFTMKNISANPLNISPEDLTERFVRGDVSRTTEGSGLGLSIARSLTEAMGGVFEIVIDGDLFKASVRMPEVEMPEPEPKGENPPEEVSLEEIPAEAGLPDAGPESADEDDKM